MVTSKQIIKGAGMWIDSEVLTTMEGAPKYGVGIAAALLSKRGEALLDKAKTHDKAKVLGIVQGGSLTMSFCGQFWWIHSRRKAFG